MTDKMKMELFEEMEKLENKANEYQEQMEKGEENHIINHQFNWTVKDCHMRTMAKIDEMYGVLRILGINKEYIHWVAEKC